MQTGLEDPVCVVPSPQVGARVVWLGSFLEEERKRYSLVLVETMWTPRKRQTVA